MNNKFSENLKKIRKDNNLSQEQLADELGVSRQAISKWESSAAYPEMDKIITLCDRFNLNIDDLLHKDIREVKGEEESKKNINKYVDDFLSFITTTINMFSSMTFKSKCKCLFEQAIIMFILFIVSFIVGQIGLTVISGLHNILPSSIYYAIFTIIKTIFYLLCLIVSIIIIIHIFKTRYLDYYQTIKKVTKVEEAKEEKIKEKEEKIEIKKVEDKIIIRDPKHSEYKFINGLFKGIVWMIKFFILCFSIILFMSLVSLFIIFILSFLLSRTGLFFIGLLISILSASVINIILILLLLNFVFNRKSNKKIMIWSFIISLITIGIGVGLLLIGTLQFKYIETDTDSLETKYIEYDMHNKLFINNHYNIEYIPSDNTNLKIEYTINKHYEVKVIDYSENIINLWPTCENPIEMIKEAFENLNNRKVIPIDGNIESIKVYTTLENINLLKQNKDNFHNDEIQRQNMVNSYEKRINELEDKLDDYIEKEYSYINEISRLEDQVNMYKNNN